MMGATKSCQSSTSSMKRISITLCLTFILTTRHASAFLNFQRTAHWGDYLISPLSLRLDKSDKSNHGRIYRTTRTRLNSSFAQPLVSTDSKKEKPIILAPKAKSPSFGFPSVDDILEEPEEELPRPGVVAPPTIETNPANPYVSDVPGVSALQNTILVPQETCILFLSASWCRTCRKITPQYNRIARRASMDGDDEIMFAKTATDNKAGKELSKLLKVGSVPTFVMFREGKVYGKPFSLTRLPSDKFDVALEYLVEGKEWDVGILREDGF